MVMNPEATLSPLANPNLPLRTLAAIAKSSVLIVAPHPDDETLGCGGAIALLRSLGCDVRVMVLSNGTMSHPRSRKYPASALQALRESESLEALSILGVAADAVTFVRLQDGAIPTWKTSGIRSAILACRACITEISPQTIFLPWRNDPHPDHRASWHLIQAALVDLPLAPRCIEYPIWDWDPDQRRDLPKDITSWRLDIGTVVELKQQAIAAYRSQTTDLIDDDPTGFRLSSELLMNFTRSWEVYLEAE